MNCLLRLYQNAILHPDKNYYIDGISRYLNSLTYTEINNFQFQRHALELDIKIDKSELIAEFFPDANNINYCSIQNIGGRRVNYFVTEKTQVAESTLRLHLRMDVLNTFRNNTDYVLSNRTRVLREHKARWKQLVSPEHLYYRVVDFYSEGIEVPLYKNLDFGKLTTNPDSTWYLIYQANADSDETIDCYLAPEVNVGISVLSSRIINASSLEDGKIYLFVTLGNDGKPLPSETGEQTKMNLSGGTIVLTNGAVQNIPVINLRLDRYQVIAITKNGTDVEVTTYVYTYNSLLFTWKHEVQMTTKSVLSLEIVNGGKYFLFDSLPSYIPINNVYDGDILSSETRTIHNLSNFASFDRTQSTIQKIIAIPYFPYTINLDANGNILVDGNFEYDVLTGFLKLKSLDTKFRANIPTDFEHPLRLIGFSQGISESVIGSDIERNDFYESKLFHSDYIQTKFVYDSFSFVFQCERYDWNSIPSLNENNFNFDFIMTTTINSKFMFKFNEPIIVRSEDYDQLLPIARNNEVVIYNSSYLNYLRTAYNYDLKAKERTAVASTLGAGFNVVSQIAGAGIGLASGNPALAIRSVIGAGSSISNSIVGSINAIASAEDNFNKNIALLKAQSVSISGSDDLDLMTAYSDNRAKICIYQVSDRIKKSLGDLFYFTGYKTDEMKTPEWNTRRIFNYLQCEPKLTINTAIPEYAIQELNNKFIEGITIFHEIATGVYDFTFTKENWEA